MEDLFCECDSLSHRLCKYGQMESVTRSITRQCSIKIILKLLLWRALNAEMLHIIHLNNSMVGFMSCLLSCFIYTVTQVFHAYIWVHFCLVLSGPWFHVGVSQTCCVTCTADNKRRLFGFSVSVGFPHSPDGFSPPDACHCKQQQQKDRSGVWYAWVILETPLWFMVDSVLLGLSRLYCNFLLFLLSHHFPFL